MLALVKGLSRNAMNVVAVIPMIPGGLVAKVISGFICDSCDASVRNQRDYSNRFSARAACSIPGFRARYWTGYSYRLDDAAHAGARTPQMRDPELVGWTRQP